MKQKTFSSRFSTSLQTIKTTKCARITIQIEIDHALEKERFPTWLVFAPPLIHTSEVPRRFYSLLSNNPVPQGQN